LELTELVCTTPVEPPAWLPPPICTAPAEFEAVLSPPPVDTGADAVAFADVELTLADGLADVELT
jgi:hypothetical protein